MLATYSTQDDLKKVKATVPKREVEGLIYFPAYDELKARANASVKLDIATKYIATHFVRYG